MSEAGAQLAGFFLGAPPSPRGGGAEGGGLGGGGSFIRAPSAAAPRKGRSAPPEGRAQSA
ncbi:Hypothetical predicted protein [Podarcis lilfordi]|uniref:Uncharacterized protein n=1 Tax=Podarcis lilfordi TaxID=74358 RepID=A0AA35P4N0_9SAUR|nr:Hypothetical predicted protein [Podarcis lilfordi]